jgi:hypothetical protein
VRPGNRVHVTVAARGVEVWTDADIRTMFDRLISDHVFVRAG